MTSIDKFLAFMGTMAAIVLVGCSDQANKSLDSEKLVEKPILQPEVGIYGVNPFYWTINGDPALLLGGSLDDNLFQMHPLEPHLDEIVANGGNYVRCTMSSRDVGNQWPYQQRNDARYDLNTWSENYWNRFEQFLKLTAKKKIVVQLEIWATWDFYAPNNGWARWPFNPRNNINYSAEESGLLEEVTSNPYEKIQPFFETVPALSNNQLVLKYQQAFVDKILSHTFPYRHILYCIDNETSADPAWGEYWARYLHQKADSAGQAIFVTEMWDDWDPSEGAVAGVKVQDAKDHPYLDRAAVINTIDHPEYYDFVDISNHNVQTGQTHFETASFVVERIRQSGKIRPVNSVKIYGGELQSDFDGEIEDSPNRFWRNIFAGLASSRFHRPPAGLGLNDLAKVNLKSMRLLEQEMDFFEGMPHNELLTEREPDEAYCWAKIGAEYAVYYPGCGEVSLHAAGLNGRQATVKWLNILEAKWQDTYDLTIEGEKIELKAPCEGEWAVVVKILPL